MAKRVTIQDIADALGISRNTVSKAINNNGSLAESTRQKILQKAIQMGYKQFSYMEIDPQHHLFKAKDKTGIAFFSSSFINESHFSSPMMDRVEKELSDLNYHLDIYRISKDNLKNKTLPPSFRPENCAAIICVEVFDYDYSVMLTEQDIPILFVDSPVEIGQAPLKADKLYMNNTDGILELIAIMKQRGVKEIGFVGEMMHCQSFCERYLAFRNGMHLSGLPIHDELCICEELPKQTEDKGILYQDYLEKKLRALDHLPELFICANDFIAIDLIQAMKALNIKAPDDVMICGFDDSSEARIVTPPLSSIHIHSQSMGVSAVSLLLSRIKEPSLDYRSLYVETNLVLRESTKDTY
ncbi:LacI family transcriptional regulator [Lachnospiraceae bacterium C10]|jgi:LacI family transcriptional regulator|nr:LacI family transcriptional regulator [Lachnospiraceae bacterium C10]SDW77634.1 transcriptional regulator, LacI family [Lachnospiraceae bacterium KHCPX20]